MSDAFLSTLSVITGSLCVHNSPSARILNLTSRISRGGKTILRYCLSHDGRVSLSIEHEEVDRCVHNDTLTCCSSATAFSPLSCEDHIMPAAIAKSSFDRLLAIAAQNGVLPCFRSYWTWQARSHRNKSHGTEWVEQAGWKGDVV
ncbi:uncharacterized protein LAESUDRAFT_305692 [Laetiporus sulphureus 93-53]|uniref:Uncharacterized protein n=1 Tax=Laetiporus sulphureus 93-53 TaxID=1314785 RepID=A0A165D8Q6_9APHY|nr:uncharacterized protein LAESUDRAFT_305692 [Laetiporus sulphureus 93-53]KZT04346.1 hypothetical protein LAESUDRAFT_305692 [Laetiporus sulphureus 93-53]